MSEKQLGHNITDGKVRASASGATFEDCTRTKHVTIDHGFEG